MKVFQIEHDLNYQSVAAEEGSGLAKLNDRDGKPIGEFEFPSLYIYDPKKKSGNFFNLFYNLLTMDQSAYGALSGQLESAGELYTMDVETKGQIHSLNVMESSDALDEENCQWRHDDGETRYGLLDYAFHGEKISAKSGLFRIKQDFHTGIYAVTGNPNQEHDFYTAYKELGLTGLKFLFRWGDS